LNFISLNLVQDESADQLTLFLQINQKPNPFENGFVRLNGFDRLEKWIYSFRKMNYPMPKIALVINSFIRNKKLFSFRNIYAIIYW